ncbi:NEL-type E3 ubiquitin ligase domain-containing protein [Pseudomonas sp. CC120222-01a]|uniref:NEL-type E3 ubiquitin ligase domain-containing protein n=1 Tax=Pseudomonas sp. CC120222-01a TaxID=1378075 RepID=UPI000D9799B7|nr:NEL-type E3 ubiquitin ligase domain-containing protein [Pseudomonas sp. CC120222-01a]PVZ43698.1 leucine rich repeat (LRR) protein [Pseudomonas sp. CC120222-01a]
MANTPIAEHSIDALIASRLPGWLKQAPVARLHELNHCLQLQQDVQHQLQALFRGLTPLDSFAEALLAPALAERLKRPVAVRQAMFDLRWLQRYPVARPEIPISVRIHHFRNSLLAAALHNFSYSETLPLGLAEGTRVLDEQGQPLPLSAQAFAELCRTLDVGGQYQAYLKRQLTPPGTAGEAIADLLERGQRYALEAAVRLAALRGEIDEQVSLRCLAAIRADKGKADGAQPMGLRLLGKRVNGVVAFEVSGEGPLPAAQSGVLCWIPNDPQGAVSWHTSWTALFDRLGRRMRLPDYPAFFQRFISERDREAFSRALASAMSARGAQVELDGRWQAIDEPLYLHLRKRLLDVLFDDAQVLGMPTEAIDEAERIRRLQFYLGAGLDLLGLASFYVPGLGVAILGIAALQVVDDLYEGYNDWALGDRQGALEHLLSVAVNVTQTVLTAGTGVLEARLLQRSAFVDGLAPVATAEGQRKLLDPKLGAYALVESETAIGQHATFDGQARLGTHQAVYQVEGDPDEQSLQIRHPHRNDAYSPTLRRLDAGRWRHEFELPQTWQGSELVRRMSSTLADVDEQTAREVLLATDFSADQLRLLHLNEESAPARLLDAVQRHRLHERYPRIRGDAFEQHVAERQVQPGPAPQLLRRDFPGLTVRSAQQIVDQADELLVERMLGEQRVPLQLAEQAWWSVRESRLDRACAGLAQAAAINADTERLAFGLLGQWLSWPESVRVELREGDSFTPAQMGGQAASEVRVIAKGPSGYEARDSSGKPLANATPNDDLMQALWLQLDTAQRQALGEAGTSAERLAQGLAQRACDRRQTLAELLGMAPPGGRVRLPRRLADGRLGYPLSGRGESSAASLRYALLRLFPSFSDAQVEEFLASSSRHGMTPWHRYFLLQEEFRQLENALDTWRRESASRVQALRRGWVARRIRQAWQRRGHADHSGHQLRIHGWRVGALPRLPERVDFGHVTHLSLNHMGLLHIEESFLQRFTGVLRLDLQDNVLTALPNGLEHLAELRELQLGQNHILLTASDAMRINTLQRLHTLGLDGNLIGRVPEVSALWRLRSVHLRATGLRELPQTLLASSSLTFIDLRDNQISEVSDAALELLRQDPRRLYLHDNPLSVQAVRRIRTLLADVDSDLLPVRRHEHGLEDERLRWLEGIDLVEQPRRLAQWDRLAAEDGAQDLFRFFADFSRSRDFTRQPQEMCRRAWAVIEACELNSEVREAVFQQAAGPRSCADQMLLIFSALEVRTLAAQRAAGLEGVYAMRPLLRLGRELFRLDQVDRIASRHIQQMREGDPYLPVDDVEVHLAYRVGLANNLSLPGQPSHMNYANVSGVHASDLEAAEREVRGAQTHDALSRSLAERDFWQSYLRTLHADWFENMDEPFHTRLDALYEQRQQMSDQDYRAAVEVVQNERMLAERALVFQLTRQAYDRHPS